MPSQPVLGGCCDLGGSAELQSKLLSGGFYEGLYRVKGLQSIKEGCKGGYIKEY